MHPIEVSAGIGAMVVAAASRAGGDVRELLAKTGFDPSHAQDPDKRIPLRTETALWDEAARICGDGAFGLHTAQQIQPGEFGVLDYVVRTAGNVREALERLERYNRIVHDAAVIRVVGHRNRIRVEHSLGAAVQSRHAAEFTLAGLIAIGRQVAGFHFAPLSVEFRHGQPEPHVVEEHEHFFGVRPAFNAPINAVELDAALGEHKLKSADPQLSRVVEHHAEALLAARPAAPDSPGERVRLILSQNLSHGERDLTLAAAARALRMSERSLQRKLAEEGLSFDALLADLRQELAKRYLTDTKFSIQEIAYLLGYSEPSAFYRAFRRWTGKTPLQARAAQP